MAAMRSSGQGMSRRMAAGFLAAVLSGLTAGCVELNGHTDALYYETHEIKNLTVILLDEKALQRRWQAVSGRPASKVLKFTVAGSQMSMADTVKGFFDYKTNTIYCTKDNFDVCGHELFHAILGRFHEER
jgi:hypothetical protein